MLQVSTSKSVLRYFPDAAVLHVGAEQSPQHSADLALALAAVALNDHHPLSLIAGNQAVADVFLQGGNVLRIEKAIQKLQPADGFRGVGVVGHGETVTDDFRFSLHKPPIQKKRPVGEVNPVWLRWKILRQRRQLHQFYNVADFAGNVADRAALQFLENLSTQRQVISHPSFGREKSPVCVDDFVSAKKIITKQGLIDTFAVKPNRLVDLTRPLVLRHGSAPPFPDVRAAAPAWR